MKIRLLRDLDFGSTTAPAGTEMTVKGERYNGQCWDAEWNGRAVIVNKKDAEEVQPQVPQA